MAIIKTLSLHEFQDEFLNSYRKDAFSNTALEFLYNYYSDENYYPNNYELDIIEVCCEWAEYGSAIETAIDFGADFDYETSTEAEALEYLKEYAHIVTELPNGSVLVYNT